MTTCPHNLISGPKAYAAHSLPGGRPSGASPRIPLERIDPRFRPVWAEMNPAEQEAMSLYFLPHRSGKALLQPARPRVIKWYCPFGHHAVFPSGHRYCINVYTGCDHACAYCYAVGYGPTGARPKRDFEKLLQKDLEDLERFGVPAAPAHLSNSTDPFQPLELRLGDTKRALEGLLRYRHRFTTITVLTKNPLLAAREDYLTVFRRLGEIADDHPARKLWQNGHPAFQVEVSLAFWREEAGAFWDKRAPSVTARIEGIRALRKAGIPVVLRIDPLFPRSPVTTESRLDLHDFGLEEAQTIEDLERLVVLAREVASPHIVYSPVKIVQPRMQPMDSAMARLRAVFVEMARPGKPVFRGGSWRLPPSAADAVTQPFLEICRKHGVVAKFCMKSLIETP